jgi:hypothetical protein
MSTYVYDRSSVRYIILCTDTIVQYNKNVSCTMYNAVIEANRYTFTVQCRVSNVVVWESTTNEWYSCTVRYAVKKAAHTCTVASIEKASIQ